MPNKHTTNTNLTNTKPRTAPPMTSAMTTTTTMGATMAATGKGAVPAPGEASSSGTYTCTAGRWS